MLIENKAHSASNADFDSIILSQKFINLISNCKHSTEVEIGYMIGIFYFKLSIDIALNSIELSLKHSVGIVQLIF